MMGRFREVGTGGEIMKRPNYYNLVFAVAVLAYVLWLWAS